MEASSQQMPPPPTPPQQQQQQMMTPPQPPQQPGIGGGPPNQNPNPGRGGRGRGGSHTNGGYRSGRGGRTGTGGRTIVNVNGRGQRGGRGRGGGRGGPPQQQGGQVQKVAPNSGIPFGFVPAYLPGSSSLVEELDQRIMIVLRDGRHLVGNLRTFDQYSNMVLDDALERSFHSTDKKNSDDEKHITYFTDVPLGMYIVRGDSIVLLGQVGSEEEEESGAAQNSIVVMKRLGNDEFADIVAGNGDDKPDDGDAPEVEASKSLEWDFDKDLLA